SLTGQPGSFSVASLTVEKGGVVVTGTDSFGAVDGADTYTQLTVAQPAGFTAQRRIRTGDVTNAGQALFQGDVKAATVANQASGTVATLGNIAAGSVANDGRWSLGGDMTAAQLVQNGMLTLTGPLANGVEVASARTIKVARFGGAATGVVSLGGASGTTVHSLTLDQSDAGLYAGTFQGAGNLIKTGAGALTLTGKNGFTGTLKVSGGTIDTTGGGTFADSLVVTVDAPAALVIGTDDMIGTLANAGATRITAASTMASLGNTGQVAVEGGLTVTGQTSNAATGTVTIAQGASGRFAQIANAGTLSNAGSLRVDGLVDNSFVGTMLLAGGASSRFGSLTNAGSIQANGALTVDGAYVQNAGTLSAGADLATGSLSGQGGTIALTNGAGYALNQTVDGRYAGSITGTGSTLVKTGAGTLTLNGQAGSFATGTLLIRVGTVAVDGAGILGQALKVDIAKEAGLTLVRGDQTISNLTGSGTLALNGNNLTLANGGTFFGTVTGTGNVRLTTGAFELTNSIDAQRGTFEVLADSTMNVKATGTLTAPTIAVIGRMNVEGSATATTTTVSNGGILHLGEASTGKAGSLATTTLTVASGGQLTGNGSVTGTTTIGGTSSGMVRPGNSPGTMTFANLTLDAQSGAVMEIEGAAGAGLSAAQGGYDHITVTGTLTLKPGSTLVLANSTGFQPALGQAINIFGVKPGAVSGMFGTATSAFRNAVAFNLSTGNVVGLGANADQFVTRVARTPNAQAMIDQLRVNRTGGVDQYRGGRLIEQVAGALATGNDRAVRDSFDRASPEVYAGLVEHQKLSMLNNTVELGGYGALRDRAVYVTGSIGHDQVKSAADADYIRFKSQDRRFNLGVAAEIPQAKVQVSYGSVNGRVTSAYMNGKARGDQFGVGVSAPVAADGALRIMGRFSHGDYDLTGTRVTNAGLASFGTVKGKATVYGGGVEYFTLGKRTSLDASVELLQVLSKVRSFGETGVDALTALSVRAQRDNVTVLRARLTAGYMVRPNWQGFARIGVDHELSEALPGVTANVISEDAAFTVRAKGLPNTRLRVGLGTQVDLNPRMAWRLEGDVGNSSTYGVKTSIALRF
ncbi:autotransporter-associated beta strand protein, partial [Sphingomonas sp. SORGH_AS802]